MTEPTQHGIRDELAAVRLELADTNQKLAVVSAQLTAAVQLESRVRAVEIAQARSSWVPVIVTSVLMSALGALVVALIDRGM